MQEQLRMEIVLHLFFSYLYVSIESLKDFNLSLSVQLHTYFLNNKQIIGL